MEGKTWGPQKALPARACGFESHPGHLPPALDLPVLTDGVVLLRPFAERDAPALAVIWRDPDIRARNRIPEPTEHAARAWVERSAACAAAGEAWEWAIVDAGTGDLAGRRALKEIDWTRRRATAACWVAPWARGRHFAARSLRLAAAHAFAHGVARIQAECDTDNRASLRSVVAAGMRYEGTLPASYVSVEGVPVDQHVFALAPQHLAAAPPFRSV
jgi:RimJ/RimL family protein N-acetyltransferase